MTNVSNRISLVGGGKVPFGLHLRLHNALEWPVDEAVDAVGEIVWRTCGRRRRDRVANLWRKSMTNVITTLVVRTSGPRGWRGVLEVLDGVMWPVEDMVESAGNIVWRTCGGSR
jgi:hypothetical protein